MSTVIVVALGTTAAHTSRACPKILSVHAEVELGQADTPERHKRRGRGLQDKKLGAQKQSGVQV